MPKVRFCSFVAALFCIALIVTAGDDCWRWRKKELTGGSPYCPVGPRFAAYDTITQKIALFAGYFVPECTIQLMYYDGSQWDIAWEGPIDMAGHPGWFDRAVTMYFDEMRSKLIMLGALWNGPESGSVGVFEFRSDHGFTCIADLYVTLSMPWGCYDAARGVAVLGGCRSTSGQGVTIEYDGSGFHVFYNPEGYGTTNGKAAFDPETGRIVFFGENRPGCGLETMEWDGSEWAIIQTSHKPEGWLEYMAYSPDFHGILAAMTICEHYPDCEPIHIWLYKDREWRLLHIQNNPKPKDAGAFFAYDPKRGKTILSGVPNSYLIESTWELEPAGHCRPVERP